MNVGGHVAVARNRHRDEPAVWLGAALPDLAAMGRFRLLGSTSDEAVAEGIAIHHRTDDAFHRHASFTAVMARLNGALTADGFERGPTRAIAHVGPELMIDGDLLHDGAVAEAVVASLELIAEVHSSLLDLVVPERRDEWGDHLDDVAGWGFPRDYDDPDAVARRLHRILGRRPRLAFERERTPEVAGHLRSEQATIVAELPALMRDLDEALSDD